MTAYKDILFLIKNKFRSSSLYAEHCAKHLKSCMFFLGMLLGWYYFYSQKAKNVTVLKYNFTDFSQRMSIYTHIEAHSDFITISILSIMVCNFSKQIFCKYFPTLLDRFTTYLLVFGLLLNAIFFKTNPYYLTPNFFPMIDQTVNYVIISGFINTRISILNSPLSTIRNT